MRKLNNSIFIERANSIHENKYDYSLVNYVKSYSKVKIICPVHGIFEQRPNSHISHKQGCPKCDNKNITTEDFIEKAKLIHGDRYDYSLVNYVKSYSKVKIICSVHSVFEKSPNDHLDRQGCPKCSDTNLQKEGFIKRARVIHGDRYDYSLVEYNGRKKSVKIVCQEHGIFEQIAQIHLKGSNCPRCMGLYKKTNEDFINDAKLIHGDRYDYSLVEYVTCLNKIKIVCSKHGVFNQVPSTHLKGSGCPICRESKGEKKIRLFLLKSNIRFIPQHGFSDCIDVRSLTFDFYLPDFNTCIEYDGQQHFVEIKKWGGKKGLLNRQRKDKIKNEYCEINKINLIRFSYLDDLKLELPIKIDYLNIYNKV
jgi:hypothetical protein